MRKALYICLVMAIAMASCKKKPDPETKYLNGALRVNHDEYILYGTPVHFEPKGITHPEGAAVGYAFTLTPNSNNGEKNDTTLHLDPQKGEDPTGAWDFLFAKRDSSNTRALASDKLTTHTLTAKAFATGYASSTAISSITTVLPGYDGKGSVTDLNFAWDEVDKFTDVRDGQKYPYTNAAGLDWMLVNSSYSGNDVKVYNVGNSSVMAKVVGGYYRRSDAEKACPAGWRLPSDAEFQTLVETLSGKSGLETYGNWDGVAENIMCKASFNGDPLWEFWPDIHIPAEPVWSVLPFGFAENISSTRGTADFGSRGVYGAFWVSDLDGDNAAYRYILYNNCNTIYIATTSASKGLGMNVRCVR